MSGENIYMTCYVYNNTMTNTPQSIRIPPELDAEITRFVEELSFT
jgi:hypothetical protein